MDENDIEHNEDADDEFTEDDEDTKSIWYYIRRLVKKDTRPVIEDKARSPKKFVITSNLLIDSFEKLNDNFLKFEISMIKKYFDKEAWKKVIDLIKDKKLHSECSICQEYCYDLCICCSECNHWYHFNCIKLSSYFRKNQKADWTCRKSKEVPLICRA